MDAQAMRWRAALLSFVFAAAVAPQFSQAAPNVQLARNTHGIRHASSRFHPPRAPRFQLVYRIDRVTATIVRRKLVVTVDGAVETGGWRHAHLVVKPSAREAPVLAFDFVANPPGPKQVVIQELLPVHATMTRGLPHYGTVAVEVIAHSNEITTEIARFN